MRTRTEHIIRLLLRTPMTVEMIHAASACFPFPYGGLSSVRSDLLDLTRRGLLKRHELSSVGAGQKQFVYFLSRRARAVVPELGELKPKSGAFRGIADGNRHALAVSEFIAHLHRSAGQSEGRAEILESLRDGYFKARVRCGGDRRNPTGLIPDGTFLCRVDDQPCLFFLELQHHAAVINPVAPRSFARSFKGKLARYKAFLALMQRHDIVQSLQAAHCSTPLRGFRVLVVTTRTDANKRNLIATAEGYQNLFYFATMAELSKANTFLDPIWSLPSGKERAIVD